MVYCGQIGFLIFFIVLFRFKLTTALSIQEKLETYELYVNTSLLTEKQDKVDINTWNEELQVQLINVTTKYRIQMSRHQRHSFRRNSKNEKWQACLKFYENSTTKLEQAYYIYENQCLKNASSSDADKRQAIVQVGREIRKWRRTYRYLMNVCHVNYPDDREQAGICLVQYMERDNYTYTFQRLVNLRLQVVKELHQEMLRSVLTLEDCLKTILSNFLEQVRSTMDVLGRCYGEKVV